jgi:DNA-binding response OmpR family regulator
VLVVDDDVDTCKNLRDILTDCGYDVSVANSGEEALPLLSRTAFDIALLDFKMPGMDGLTLSREIRKRWSGTVAVLISAFAEGEAAEQALRAGAWRVLHKPLNVGQLLPLIESAVRQPIVLVVDDDHDLCTNLWEILHEQGFRLDVAHSETEAAQQLAGRNHGVVLIDMRLPSGDGGGVYHLVRQFNPQARVVLITGFRSDVQDLVQRTVAEGADAVCYKPFAVPELLNTINRLAMTGKQTP